MRRIWLTVVSQARGWTDGRLLTLSSKGQLVIPARWRQWLGLRAGDRLALSLDFADALHRLRSEGCAALVSFDRAFVRKAGELSPTPPLQPL